MNYLNHLILAFLLIFISEISQANKGSITRRQPSRSSPSQEKVRPSQQLTQSLPSNLTNNVRSIIDFSVSSTKAATSCINQLLTRAISGEPHFYNFINAVLEGDLERTRSLIALGVNVNTRDTHNTGRRHAFWTSLMYATRNLDLEMIKLLARSGADMNKTKFETWRYWTPLTIAYQYGMSQDNLVNIIDFLIKSGIRVNLRNIFGSMILKDAKKDNPKTYKLLTSSEIIDGRYRNRTELMFASYRGDIGTVQRLINEGIDINARDSHNWTAYMIAVFEGHSDIADLLNISGANFISEDYQILLDAGMQPWVYQLDASEPFMNDIK